MTMRFVNNGRRFLLVPASLLLAVVGQQGGFAATLSSLYSFSGGQFDTAPNDGANPAASLVLNFDGKFYGTTSQGGLYANGTIFQTTTSGAVTTLYSFSGFNQDGAGPVGMLVPGINLHGVDGFLYGATAQGGRYANGSLFKVTSSGAFTSLYSFQGTADGANPQAGLFEGLDGNFYGTTLSGGIGNSGVIFKITPAGAFNVIHGFSATDVTGINTDGANPAASLVLNLDGSLYGTTQAGGAHGQGTIFKVSRTGVFTTLYSFTGADGSAPIASLLPDLQGNLYGTTQRGGPNGTGEVFKWKHNGGLVVLHSFAAVGASGANSDGAYPAGNLIPGKNGALYGTTPSGGALGFGTVYSITTGGAFTPLYSFINGVDGSSPQAGLFPDTHGNLYGVAYSGGSYGLGTVFVLNP